MSLPLEGPRSQGVDLGWPPNLGKLPAPRFGLGRTLGWSLIFGGFETWALIWVEVFSP